jgi:hypothetical protein
MVLAVAVLMFQIAPVVHSLPDVALASTTKVAERNSSDSLPDQPKPAAASSASGKLSDSSSGTLTTIAFETSRQNSQSLSTIRIPDAQPSKPVRVIAAEGYPSRKSWLLLSIAEHSAATFDAYSTRQAIAAGATEADPTMRPFAHSPAIYGAIQVGPAILDFAARRMQRSQNSLLRRTWWVPQSASTGIFLFSGVHNMSFANRP